MSTDPTETKTQPGPIRCRLHHGANNSQDPIWPIIRMVVLFGMGVIAFNLFYSTGFDLKKDGSSLVLFLTSIGAVDYIKAWIGQGKVGKEDDSEDK